jgi:hypothetical protein
MDVPLPILDQEVARAAAALASARAPDGEAPNPLEAHRRASSRATWLALAEAGPAPLVTPLRAWVFALTLERVLWDDTVRLAVAWSTPSITVAETGIAAFTASPRDLLRRVLGEADPARRRIWGRALADSAGPASDAARILAERRVEAARLMESPGPGLDVLEIPVDPPAALSAAAARLLTDTARFHERTGSWPAALAAGVGREHGRGWPARLGPRWLFDLFSSGPLTEGLSLAIPPLPAALGATSFARALGAFGAALADADGPRTSFSLARAPFDLRSARRAALFAGLAADPVFAARALGLGRDRARDQARGVARALLVGLRLDAARVLCRGVLSLPDGERAPHFEQHTATALGLPLPPPLAGVVPRLGADDPVRFAGALVAAVDHRRLVDRFDEDWFRNPHAARAIREEDAVVPASRVAPAAALDAGVVEIVRVLADLG